MANNNILGVGFTMILPVLNQQKSLKKQLLAIYGWHGGNRTELENHN